MSVIGQPIGDSKIATSAGTSTPIILPPTTTGAKPQFVRVASTGRCLIRFGDSAIAVFALGYQLNPNEPEMFAVPGETHFAIVDAVDTGVTVNLTPMSVSR